MAAGAGRGEGPGQRAVGRRRESRGAAYLSWLTRTRDVDERLAHRLRVAAHRGRLSAEQVAAAAALLRQLPERSSS